MFILNFEAVKQVQHTQDFFSEPGYTNFTGFTQTQSSEVITGY